MDGKRMWLAVCLTTLLLGGKITLAGERLLPVPFETDNSDTTSESTPKFTVWSASYWIAFDKLVPQVTERFERLMNPEKSNTEGELIEWQASPRTWFQPAPVEQAAYFFDEGEPNSAVKLTAFEVSEEEEVDAEEDAIQAWDSAQLDLELEPGEAAQVLLELRQAMGKAVDGTVFQTPENPKEEAGGQTALSPSAKAWIAHIRALEKQAFSECPATCDRPWIPIEASTCANPSSQNCVQAQHFPASSRRKQPTFSCPTPVDYEIVWESTNEEEKPQVIRFTPSCGSCGANCKCCGESCKCQQGQTPDVQALRESSLNLDEVANGLEERNLFEQADEVRAMAQKLRMDARAKLQLGTTPSQPVKFSDPQEPCSEARSVQTAPTWSPSRCGMAMHLERMIEREPMKVCELQPSPITIVERPQLPCPIPPPVPSPRALQPDVDETLHTSSKQLPLTNAPLPLPLVGRIEISQPQPQAQVAIPQPQISYTVSPVTHREPVWQQSMDEKWSTENLIDELEKLGKLADDLESRSVEGQSLELGRLEMELLRSELRRLRKKLEMPTAEANFKK